MSDPDEERRQRGHDSVAEYRRLQRHQRKRYPEQGDLSLSETVSLYSNSHAPSTETAGVDTDNIRIFAREDASYSDPLYARVGIRSPKPLSATVNLPVKRDTKPTDGLYHSVGATYTLERKLSPVPFPKIVGIRDITRPTGPLESFEHGAEAEPEIPENIPLEESEPYSLSSGLFRSVPTTSSQLGDEGEEAESSEITTSSLSEELLSQSPSISETGDAEPLAERAEISGDLGDHIPLGIPHPLASSTPAFHYQPVQVESADAETTIDQAFAGIQIPDQELERPDLLK